MKVFTKEIKVSLTAICAVALLIYGINFLKGINLFQKSNLYYVAFDDIKGLCESNPVYASGYQIGIVRTIDYDYDHPGNVYVGIELKDDMHITEDSRAELVTEMLGGVKMNIILGRSPRAISPGDTIKGAPQIGALDQAAAMMPQVQAMMPKLDSILTGVNALVNDPALHTTLANAAELTTELKTTTKTINTLLEGDVKNMTANLGPATANLKSISEKLDKIDYVATMNYVNQTMIGLQNLTTTLDQSVNTTMSSLNDPNSSLGLLLHDRALYDNLNKNLVSSDSLLIDLRQHPSRYVHFSIFGKKDR